MSFVCSAVNFNYSYKSSGADFTKSQNWSGASRNTAEQKNEWGTSCNNVNLWNFGWYPHSIEQDLLKSGVWGPKQFAAQVNSRGGVR